MLSDRCLSVCLSYPVLSVCNFGVLWPNGWMDQDETCLAGRPRPWPHRVRWGPRSPPPKGAQPPQLSAHICCGQMAGWIKMPLGMKVAPVPSNFMLGGDPALPPQKVGGAPAPNFGPCLLWPNGWMDQDGTWHGDGLSHIVLDGDPAPLPKNGCRAPIVGPLLLWPNGWMLQDATWYEGRPQHRRLCVR